MWFTSNNEEWTTSVPFKLARTYKYTLYKISVKLHKSLSSILVIFFIVIYVYYSNEKLNYIFARKKVRMMKRINVVRCMTGRNEQKVDTSLRICILEGWLNSVIIYTWMQMRFRSKERRKRRFAEFVPRDAVERLPRASNGPPTRKQCSNGRWGVTRCASNISLLGVS